MATANREAEAKDVNLHTHHYFSLPQDALLIMIWEVVSVCYDCSYV